MSTTLTKLEAPVLVSHQWEEERWSRTCQATIPAAHTVTVESGVPEVDDPANLATLKRLGYWRVRIYAHGDTKAEALQNLGSALRGFGYTGTMRLVHLS